MDSTTSPGSWVMTGGTDWVGRMRLAASRDWRRGREGHVTLAQRQ